MKKIIIMLFSISLLLISTSCSGINVESKSNKTTLTVSAASSLSAVLGELGTLFEEENPDLELRFNFGASGTLKQQIEQGAPVDLFLSAAADKYEELVKDEYIHTGTNLVNNELVLITSKNAAWSGEYFRDLTSGQIHQLAIGTPGVVPAGTYAQQVLQSEGVWDHLQEKLILAKDVQQVLTYVETGNVEAGIVYKTDAMQSTQVKVVAKANPNYHEPIIYPVGVLKHSNHIKEALVFYEYLKSEEAEKLWSHYGFHLIKNDEK